MLQFDLILRRIKNVSPKSATYELCMHVWVRDLTFFLFDIRQTSEMRSAMRLLFRRKVFFARNTRLVERLRQSNSLKLRFHTIRGNMMIKSYQNSFTIQVVIA